jgi:hypothetical protein
MGDVARRRVEADFSSDRMVDAYRRVYEEFD